MTEDREKVRQAVVQSAETVMKQLDKLSSADFRVIVVAAEMRHDKKDVDILIGSSGLPVEGVRAVLKAAQALADNMEPENMRGGRE